VITNIGRAHIGRLGSREAIAAAKCEITAGLHPKGTVVIPAGDPLLESALAAVWSGRVLRVRLADDPEVESDLVGDVNGDQLLSRCRSSPATASEGRHTPATCSWPSLLQTSWACPARHWQGHAGDGAGRDGNRRLQQGGLTLLDETYNASA